MRFFIILLTTVFLFSHCTKREIINDTDHINYIVDSNQVPNYEGVTTIQIENYVNKLYIDLLGREPLAAERNNAVAALKTTDLDALTRAALVADLQDNPEYFDQLSKTYLAALLGGVDSLRINDEIIFLQFLENAYAQAGQDQLSQFYGYERLKLENTNKAIYQYELGHITINEYLLRICHNYLYDQINMGSENYAVSCFEGLLKRLPTEAEKTASVNMVDGVAAYLFLQDGTSKGDFIFIVTQSQGFYEGLSIDIYQRLLARRPSSIEMGTATIDLKNGNKNYQDVERDVAVSDEYAGF